MKLIYSFLVIIYYSLNSYAISVQDIKRNNFFSIPVSYYEKGEVHKALESLKTLKVPKNKEAHRYFLMSRYSLELSYFEEARKHIDKAIELKIDLNDYAHFTRGLIEWESKKNLEQAEVNFLKALQFKPIRSLKNDINYYLAKTYFAQQKLSEAKPIIEKLRSSFKYDKRRPEVIWLSLQIYSAHEDKVSFCRWSRNLYSNYSFSKYIDDWSINLPKNKVNGKETGCHPIYSEKKRRIKKLLWAGKNDKAKKDIEILKKSKTVSSKDIDRLTAEYLLHIGDVKPALKLLLKNYKNVAKDFDYLMLLGHAAYKSGEYQTAVGSYHKAFKLKPNSEKGKRALFRSAFLSYQFQDYDGATRKYLQFIKNFPGSSLVKDAKYHISWMKYLRGQYKLAIQGFEKILEERKKSRRGWRKYPTNRIQYWLAMSYLKLNENKIAWHIFKNLSEKRGNNYYSFTALSRLKQIPYDAETVKIGEIQAPRTIAKSNYNFEKALENAQIKNAFFKNETNEEMNDNISEEENLDFLRVDAEVSKEFWSKPKIQKNISRVETLIEMGQTDWAYRDLKFIEAHVKDKSMYNQFIKNYRLLNKYTRSSYLTELKIIPSYSDAKLEANLDVWQLAYPKAFESIVNNYASLYSVPNHFIWSIMRAESRYNPSAESPVGAKGLMQLMPYTARHLLDLLGKSKKLDLNLHDPKTNIQLGTRYLNRLLKQFKNQMPLAAAAYNAGPHRVKSWLAKFGNLELDEFIEHIPFVETRNYVKRVTRFLGTYNKAYNKNTTPMSFLAQNIPIQHKGPIPTKEDWSK